MKINLRYPNGITIRTSSYQTVRDDGFKVGIFERHREELENELELLDVDPMDDKYFALEELGLLHLLEVRKDEELIGYSVNFISPFLQHGKALSMTNHLLYLEKGFRTGRIGLNLIGATELLGKVLRCNFIMWSAKPSTSLDRIMRRRKGYVVQQIIHLKEL